MQEPKLPTLPTPNAKALEQLIKHDVPKHLHKLVTALIICISTELDAKLERAKIIADYESLILSDKDIKLAQNKALAIVSGEVS